MRPHLLFFLVLFASTASGLTEVQVNEVDRPRGAAVLVVDGMGASYVYPEHGPRSLDGSPLEGALLFNLTGEGARVLDVRVPVPSTGPAHSVLVTGCSWADPALIGSPGVTIFDLARKEEILCVAILQRGDSTNMLLEQDAVLFFEDNSIHDPEPPVVGARADAPQDLTDRLQLWRDRFPVYAAGKGRVTYVGYDAWGLDAAADLVGNLSPEPFLLFVNVGAVDSAGHNTGCDGYLETIKGLDVPLGRLIQTCRENRVLLLITADHGMAFSTESGRGGHASSKYSSKIESLRVPAVFLGPDVEEVAIAGTWSQTDLAPTLLDLLDLEGELPWSEGGPIPVAGHYDLEVRAPGNVVIRRGGEVVAKATGDSHYFFRGLERGGYTVEAGGKVAQVPLNGDKSLDLTSGSGWLHLPRWDRKILGAVLILMINLVGAAMIIRIVRRG